jgi:hypothetical protein
MIFALALLRSATATRAASGDHANVKTYGCGISALTFQSNRDPTYPPRNGVKRQPACRGQTANCRGPCCNFNHLVTFSCK